MKNDPGENSGDNQEPDPREGEAQFNLKEPVFSEPERSGRRVKEIDSADEEEKQEEQLKNRNLGRPQKELVRQKKQMRLCSFYQMKFFCVVIN